MAARTGSRPRRPWPVLGRERADPAQDARQAALLAEDVELERLDGGHVRGGRPTAMEAGQHALISLLEDFDGPEPRTSTVDGVAREAHRRRPARAANTAVPHQRRGDARA